MLQRVQPCVKISIITVAFNAANTIAETLDSVAAQSHRDIEHIVIDGASRDGTQRIVREMGRQVTKFVSEPDCGIYDAMNKGIALATGDLIGILNADDHYADHNVLARVSTTMEGETLDALYGDVGFYRTERPAKIVRRYRSNHFSPRNIAWGWMPAHPTLFLRREIYQRVGYFRTDYQIAGDFEFIARVFTRQALRARYLPEILVLMRIGGISTAGWRNSILLNREVLRACRENGVNTNVLKILSKYPMKLLERIIN